MSKTSKGTLFLIVGPSGVGKDTLLDGAKKKLSGDRFHFSRRFITRPIDKGGEDHIPITERSFSKNKTKGTFFHTWQAHGFKYGINENITSLLASGVNVVVNVSRNEVQFFKSKLENVITIQISAPREIIEKRLRERGREIEKDINLRLNRIVEQPFAAEGYLEIINDDSVEAGVENLVDVIVGSCNLLLDITHLPIDISGKAVCLIHKDNITASRLLLGVERVSISSGEKSIVAELGWTDSEAIAKLANCAVTSTVTKFLNKKVNETVEITRSPNPKSRITLQKKIRGAELSYDEFHQFVGDLINSRYSSSEIAGFLVSAAQNLTLNEVIHLTKARASFAQRHCWDSDVVVDKHSMGGIPGNRISLIIIPIIASFGLKIPKTSSRAITSAAGTADCMEVLAQVDLTPKDMKAVVDRTGGCIAWNGRLTHSPVDDVMNSINRPLGLASALLDVSSIMSKKLAAGSTHVWIDLPIGPQAKTKTTKEGEYLKELFEAVGEGVGLKTYASLSNGCKPIGRGIGPVLEAMDVLDVLKNKADAPQDLREKSIDYAAKILEWSQSVPANHGHSIAERILLSGEAYQKFQEIIDAQGKNSVDLVAGQFTHDVLSSCSGEIEEMDIRCISNIAIAAGAPVDQSAGVFLYQNVGAKIEKGEPLLRIHSATQKGLLDAKERAESSDSIVRRWR